MCFLHIWTSVHPLIRFDEYYIRSNSLPWVFLQILNKCENKYSLKCHVGISVSLFPSSMQVNMLTPCSVPYDDYSFNPIQLSCCFSLSLSLSLSLSFFLSFFLSQHGFSPKWGACIISLIHQRRIILFFRWKPTTTPPGNKMVSNFLLSNQWKNR